MANRLGEAVIGVFKLAGLPVGRFDRTEYGSRKARKKYASIFEKYRALTMVPYGSYVDNLELVGLALDVPGDVVECGVWRGGMMAGMAEVMGPSRKYWLFDSFEGLPPAGELDGQVAIDWQNRRTAAEYFDNCSAEESFALRAMKSAAIQDFRLVKGWFKDTVPDSGVSQIAVLRLDGDWYESTMTCLEAFYPSVSEGGVIILDDYNFWDGCTRAVHDFLSRHELAERIRQSPNGVAYVVKNWTANIFRDDVSVVTKPTNP